jgi:hypothetical protein
MTVFHLFRIKIEKPHQEELFAEKEKTSSQTIKEAIQQKRSHETRKNQIWRIGNIEKISDHEHESALFFAFGKVTKAKRELYDDKKGDFLQEDHEEGPHTYVFVDLKYQVCAIAKKTQIAQMPRNIAINLSKLLDEAEVSKFNHIKFAITSINDPEEFILLIRNAELISQFEMSFSPPNPFDANEDFHAPMERLLQATGAGAGMTRIDGDNLDSTVLEELTRSAAATGNEVKAKIKSPGDQKPISKKLSGNDATIVSGEPLTKEEKSGIINLIRSSYRKIRGTDDTE